jgi:hypothetical protein
MLKKQKGTKLEISNREKSKVYGGGICGQACYYSCPIKPKHRTFCDFSSDYIDWMETKFPPNL